MEKIYEGKGCKAEFISDKRRVLFSIIGYPVNNELEVMYNTVVKFMHANSVIAFLHDLREFKGTFTGMNDFIIAAFRPAFEKGFRHSALILNNDVFTSFAADDLLKKTTIIQTQVFNSQMSAEIWLDERLADSAT